MSTRFTVHRRLKSLIAVWFVLQIVLPFTAPPQTCDLSDLLGTHKHSSSSPESSTTPTTNEAEAEGNSFVSPLVVSELRVSTSLAVMRRVLIAGLFGITIDLSSSLHVQQTVLRV